MRTSSPAPAARRGPVAAALGEMGPPLAASVVLHAVIGTLLLLSTWSSRDPLGGGGARTEVVINIPPPPAPAAGRAEAAVDPAPPAPVSAPPPVLQGLASRSATASLPALRSAGAEAPAAGDLLRREDESAIGATFAGLGARRAGSVVYVVDASGAMVSSLKWVLKELERSVGALSSGQRFQVILFREKADGTPYEVFGGPGSRLVPASLANKAGLSQWLDSVGPLGRSNPLDGLRRGLELDPDAIFLLSRSIRRSTGEQETGVWGRGPQETLAELERLNPRNATTGARRVVIKAIQFVEEDPSGTMQLIGTEHGDGPGSYRVLTLQDLGAR